MTWSQYQFLAMKNKLKTIGTILHYLFYCVLFVSLDASAFQPPNEVVIQDPSKKIITIQDFIDRKFFKSIPPGIDIVEISALAANVYQNTNVVDHECISESPGMVPNPGWENRGGWIRPKVCNKETGMQFDVWTKLSGDDYTYVAIVFRGTDEQIDWCSNFRWLPNPFCKKLADQYLFLAELIDRTLDGIYDSIGPDRYVFSVGHSLGGGLAELSGRVSYISDVFTFNSTPITGGEISEELFEATLDVDTLEIYSKKLYDETGCEYYANNPSDWTAPKVVRVYEKGDILSIPRAIKKIFSSEWNNNVLEFRTNVLTGNPVKEHDMKALACALRVEKEHENESPDPDNAPTDH